MLTGAPSEQLNDDDSPPSSPASLETPKDALFSNDLSAPRVAAADATFSSFDAESSANYPVISSMEVEVSGTEEDFPLEVAPMPKPVIEPKTPQRASEVFGFLNRRNTVTVKERELPELPQDTAALDSGAPCEDNHNTDPRDTFLNPSHDATHSANTSHSASNTSSDTPSHFSHAQIHTATMTKLKSAFASSTLSLNLLQSSDDAIQTEHTIEPDTGAVTSAVPTAPVQAIHQHTGSSSSSGNSSRLPPSRIPRGPRPRPHSSYKNEDTVPCQQQTASDVTSGPLNIDNGAGPSAAALSRSAKREALSSIPQRQHRRITSRSSTKSKDHEDAHVANVLKTPGPSTSYTRKRSTKPELLAQTHGKENTPSPPRASPKTSGAAAFGNAANGLGFATPARARTVAERVLDREDMQPPPSPASSSELSPVAQDMMHNLRQQRMRARQVERRKGIWVRE
ncbi:hypothetical protein C8Q70DRAFT_1037244 [Cubamyces menziesii]|nr:hypothetical protein C8Q70DRAFT_1037244 [Cubamyces menziesii]